MALETNVNVVHMISVHEIPEGVNSDQPSVFPGKFWIPPVSPHLDNGQSAEALIREKCVVGYREPGMTKTQTFAYAELRKDSNGNRYILLSIPDAKTIRHGTEEQKFDEWRSPLNPPVERAYLHVRAQESANEIERQLRHLSIVTIRGEEPTSEELRVARDTWRNWVMQRVRETSAGFARFGAREVTQQSLYLADYAFKKGWLRGMPEWAAVDVSAPSDEIFPCTVCGRQLRKAAVRCDGCGAVYDWRRAIEFGIKRLEDVPQSKRAELADLFPPQEVAPVELVAASLPGATGVKPSSKR